MIPAGIAAWKGFSRRAVRPLDPADAADATATAAAKETLAASLGRDSHALQYAATPEGARALAEDMVAVNLDRAARRPPDRWGGHLREAVLSITAAAAALLAAMAPYLLPACSWQLKAPACPDMCCHPPCAARRRCFSRRTGSEGCCWRSAAQGIRWLLLWGCRAVGAGCASRLQPLFAVLSKRAWLPERSIPSPGHVLNVVARSHPTAR